MGSGNPVPTDIVFPRAIKFRENKDVGYIGRLVNGIINISRPALLSLSHVAFLHTVRASSREIPLPIIYAKS